MIEYKGYVIERNFYKQHEYSIQFEGDDLIFGTLEEAKAFIDEVLNENNLR